MPLLFVSGYDFPLSYGDNNKTGALLHNEMTAPKVQTLGEYSAQRHLREKRSHQEMQKQVPTAEIYGKIPSGSHHHGWECLRNSTQRNRVTLVTWPFLKSVPFFFLCSKCSHNESVSLNLVSIPISLPKGPAGAVHWEAEGFHHCRNTPLLRPPCTTSSGFICQAG